MATTGSYVRGMIDVPKEKATNYLQIPKDTLLSENFTKLSTKAKVTYLGLLSHWVRNPNHKDRAWKVKITYSRLIKTTGLSKTTLWRALKELSSGKEEDRFISEIDNHFIYCANEYELNPKWLTLIKIPIKPKK